MPIFFTDTGSFNQINVTGSLTVLGGITGSFSGSILGYVSNNSTGSFIINSQTGSFATTGSNVFNGNQTITGSLIHGGINNTANINSHAEGFSTQATGTYSHAEGESTTASGNSSHAEGNATIASGDFSHAEGQYTLAESPASHTEGDHTYAQGQASHAEGLYTTASADYSHTEGERTWANGQASHAEGQYTVTSNDFAHAEGVYTLASGIASHTEGYYTTASGDYSHAEGYNTQANGVYSHAEGNVTTANGQASHAEGDGTVANGVASHAEGSGTQALGISSHAEGTSTLASASYSHAEGDSTIAYGIASHAEGVGNYTGQLGYLSNNISSGEITLEASYGDVKNYIDGLTGYIILDDREYDNIYGCQLFEISSITSATPTIIYLVDANVDTLTAKIGVPGVAQPTNADAIIEGRSAHSEGSSTIASGYYSHTAGEGTSTIGISSYAGGSGSIAYRPGQTVVGQFNLIDRENQDHYNNSFVIGKGTNVSTRNNIFSVQPNVDELLISASTVYVKGLINSPASAVVTINPTTGQLYYTASSAFGGSTNTLTTGKVVAIANGLSNLF